MSPYKTNETNKILVRTNKDFKIIPPYTWHNDSILSSYIKDIKDIPLIDRKREKELAFVIQKSKDKKAVLRARNELVSANLRLVVKCAWNFYKKLHDPGQTKITLLDLIMEGNMGLMRAVDLFKPEFNNKFSTYAIQAIIHQISVAFKEFRFIRIPIKHFKYTKIMNGIKDFYNNDISKKELLKKSRIPQYSFERIIEESRFLNDGLLSLALFEEEIIAGKEQDIVSIVANKELKEDLLSKINALPPLLRDVMLVRFFDTRELKMEEIAKELGITKQAISQRIKRGLKCLKKKIIEEEMSYRFNKNKKGK
jgi:RNA polymerase sigma factor (sigma-70 family)